MSPKNISQLTDQCYWDKIYLKASVNCLSHWHPVGYEERALAFMFDQVFAAGNVKSVLEVGCGNSTWLPYLAQKYNVAVTGIDYSEEGVLLARQQLLHAGVAGKIHHADIFAVNCDEIGTFDLVYSLGVIEHFENTDEVVNILIRFVKQHGLLLAEVPNLFSIHGLAMRLYQPEVYSRHRVLRCNQLQEVYERNGLEDVNVSILGLASIGIVSWGVAPRYPNLEFMFRPLIRIAQEVFQRTVGKLKIYKGIRLFAPFVYISGRKR